MPFPDPLDRHIAQIAEALDLSAEAMTVVKMHPGHDERHRELELLQGSWDVEHPWIILDEHDHPHTMTSAQSLSKMIALLAAAQGESFQLKLEKAIWQRYPIDFYDVWAVAMERIKRRVRNHPKSTVVTLDLDWLVSEIKQEYPNLFYHLDQLLTHP